MDAVWSGAEGAVVGIVDGESNANPVTDATADAFESILAAHDATAVRGDLETVLADEPSLLVAAGASDLSAIARVDADCPVLPVGDVAGVDAVDRSQLSAAVDAVLEGEATRRSRVVLGVDLESESDAGTDGDIDTDSASLETTGGATAASRDGRERALFDVTLVTDEPARISEYGVTSRGESVGAFRADGVVVATPAGSHGYASAVDAPSLSAAVDAVAVAPIAPFVTDTRRWVVPDDDLALTVERDEGDVALVVDDRRVTSIGVGTRITISADETLETLRVPDDALEDR